MPAEQRRGQAFCALLEAVDPDRLPLHGGTATTVVVTIPFEGLAAGAGVGTLGDGTRISASEARRLACGANILPAVLDGDSEVLDLGRTPTTVLSPRSARPSPSASAPAEPTGARCRRPGVKPTTPGNPGPAAVAPTSPTGCCSAPGTTTASTTTATSSRTPPTAESASTDERKPTNLGRPPGQGWLRQVRTSYGVACQRSLDRGLRELHLDLVHHRQRPTLGAGLALPVATAASTDRHASVRTHIPMGTPAHIGTP